MDLNIIFAFIPLFGWAFGDFFIQRTVRKVSVVQSLFYICGATIPVLFFFVWKDLLLLSKEQIFALSMVGFLVFIYAIAQFRAMQVGKLSVIETIIGLELPMTVMLATILGGDKISGLNIFFIALVCLGVLLTSMKDLGNLKIHKHIKEKGIVLALVASILSALTNFLIGNFSQQISPLVTIFVVHLIVTIISFMVLIINGEVKETYTNLFKYPKLIFLQTFFDNVAWISYAIATTVISISLVITFSESYIVLAAFLGYFFNKEKLNSHQKLGAIIALSTVVIMSFTI